MRSSSDARPPSSLARCAPLLLGAPSRDALLDALLFRRSASFFSCSMRSSSSRRSFSRRSARCAPLQTLGLLLLLLDALLFFSALLLETLCSMRSSSDARPPSSLARCAPLLLGAPSR